MSQLTTKIPLVYIAGPFRAKTFAEIERNVQLAALFRAPIANAGAFPICVHLNEGLALHDCQQENNGQWWVDATLEVLRRCDAVVVVPGFEKSLGTLGEIAEALRLELPIFYAAWSAPCRPAKISRWGVFDDTSSFADWVGKERGCINSK